MSELTFLIEVVIVYILQSITIAKFACKHGSWPTLLRDCVGAVHIIIIR